MTAHAPSSSSSTALPTASALTLLGGLYFAQGLPFGFFTEAVPVAMREAGFDLGAIGLTSVLALPWALKFLWAPLLDARPGLRARRRTVLALQLVTAGVVALLGLLPLDAQVFGFALLPLFFGMFVTNLLAATQDIATDGLAVRLLAPAARGLGNGLQVAAYRLGMIVGGGGLLIVFSTLGWTGISLAMSMLLLLSTIPTFLWRPERAPAPPATAALPVQSVFKPLKDALVQPGMAAWLVLIFVFKSADTWGIGMVKPFLVDIGLKTADIGWLSGTLGSLAGLIGALGGGALLARFGRRPMLLCAGLGQAGATMLYALAAAGTSHVVIGALIFGEHLVGGMATAALFTAMMDRARAETAATDYTLQACVVVLGTGLGRMAAGFSAQAWGHGTHFIASGAAGLLATAALAWWWPRVALHGTAHALHDDTPAPTEAP